MAHGLTSPLNIWPLYFIARQYDYIVELVATLKYAEKNCKKKKKEKRKLDIYLINYIICEK